MRVLHTALFGAALLGGCLAACDSDSDKNEGEKPANAAAQAQGKLTEGTQTPASDLPGLAGDVRTHLDLLELAHLADLDHQGLFIDFGTPARMKYTVGHWRTGWGRDEAEADTTFTYVAGTTGRVYFPVDEAKPITLRFRIKPVGTQNMMLFLNNHQLPSVSLDKGKKFADYDVQVPAEHVVAGENYLLLRLGGTEKVGKQDVSIAVDSIRVIPGTPGEGAFQPPRYAQLVRDVSIASQRQRALVVQAPTRLSWYVEVPEDATLGFRSGLTGATGSKTATVRVRITPEGGKPKEVHTQSVEGRWRESMVSLAGYAGKVARVDLVADGKPGAEVAWAAPSLLTPRKALEAPAKQAKNVVVLTIDTLRADKLKPYNAKTRVRTPALDAIAEEGVVFTAAQSPENWTKPAVASILTGLYPATHGTKESDSRLPDDALLLSEALKASGFATGSFLANGYVSDKFGFDQGWDHYTNYIRENKRTEAENVFREAAAWIEKHKDERFFAYIQTIDPHVPYDPPDDILKLYDARDYSGQVKPRRTPDLLEKAKRNPPKVTFTERDKERIEALYDAEITYHDRNLAKLVERLKKLKLYDDTLIVVTSDHGEELDDHGSWGHGHSVYQELLHVPFIVRLPGVAPAGTRVEEAVNTLDIPPTVLEALGLEVPEVMEGVSRIDHSRGVRPLGPAVAFSDFLDDRRTIRAGRWKLVLRGLNETLFDLERDPGEQRELDRAQHAVAMRYCRILLGQFLGASDRRHWLKADQRARGGLRSEDADIDPELRGQLKALGYAH